MVESWNDDTPGLVTLPSGVRVRGRGLRAGLPAGMQPTLGVYLAGRPPPPTSWEQRWIRWPDFWIPTDAAAATRTLREALEAASEGRVEIACGGGVGRTGTALAALCVLEGAAPHEAVRHVRARYARRAVELPWQLRFIRRIADLDDR